MKKFIIMSAIVLGLCSSSVMADEGISLIINGESVSADVMPQIIEGRTMVPVRTIFEAVGAEVSWNGDTKTVTGVKGDTVVTMSVDSKTETINGESVEMDTAPMVIEGRTLAPARFVAEAFGGEVSWNGEKKEVSIVLAQDEEESKDNIEETSEITSEEANEDADIEEEMLNFFLEVDSKPEAIDNSKIGDEDLIKLHEDVRYAFEQKALPQALFNDSENMADLIVNDTDGFSDAVSKLWDENASPYILEYLLNYGVTNIADTDEFITHIESDSYLYCSDNVAFTFGMLNEDTYLTLLEMADDNYLTSCSYIGIVYNKDFGFKYYTLEKSLDNYYAICHVNEESRGTYTAFEDAGKDNKEIFIRFIKDNLDK